MEVKNSQSKVLSHHSEYQCGVNDDDQNVGINSKQF